MFEDGLSYPLQGDSALGRIIIGGLLGFGSVLIVPGFALMGYLVWVLGGAARGEEEPPAFDDWGEIIVVGLKATVVTLIYGVVPFMLVFVSIFVIAGGATGSETGMGILGGIGLLGMLVSVVAMFLLYYIIPAALTSMALEGSIEAAFDFGTIKQVVLSANYLLAWLIPFVLPSLANVVTAVLAITVIGLLAVPFMQFYIQVAAFYMFGAAFGKAVGVADRSADVDTAAA